MGLDLKGISADLCGAEEMISDESQVKLNLYSFSFLFFSPIDLSSSK